MNITQLINANNSSISGNLTGAQTSAQATAKVGPVSPALKKADARIQSQSDTTRAQLSMFGKLKSSVSEVQLAARKFSAFTVMSPIADVKIATHSFLAAFNAAINAAKATAAVAGGSLAQTSSANRVSRDLGKSVSADTPLLDSLKKIGVKQLSDGTLSLDAAKFDAAQKADPAAVQSTLSKIGQLVDKTATRELASGGNVDGSMALLNQRSTALKAQQNALLAMDQTLSAAQSTPSSGYVGYGLAAYRAKY